jgi:antitoxin component YwqK of YwqJK toxin-antitoxin module
MRLQKIPIYQKDKNSKRHGVWESYWPDGTPRWRRHYHHGMLKGLSKWRETNGKVPYKAYRLIIK